MRNIGGEGGAGPRSACGLDGVKNNLHGMKGCRVKKKSRAKHTQHAQRLFSKCRASTCSMSKHRTHSMQSVHLEQAAQHTHQRQRLPGSSGCWVQEAVGKDLILKVLQTLRDRLGRKGGGSRQQGCRALRKQRDAGCRCCGEQRMAAAGGRCAAAGRLRLLA